MSNVLDAVMTRGDANILEGVKTLLKSVDVGMTTEAGNSLEAEVQYSSPLINPEM